MLPKNHRLSKKNDFDQVFSAGQSIKSGFFVAKMAKNALPSSRFGFVVSKKVAAKANVRNKLKRRMRDAVAGYLKTVTPNQAHSDIIIIALPQAAQQEFAEVKLAMGGILKKISI